MNRSDQDRLLREILADENIESLRAASLAGGLAALHTRRRRRALLSGVAASTAIAAILAVLSSHRAPVAIAPPPLARSVTVIDDQQLLALFPDRTVALIGAPGNQKLFFADTASASATRPENP